MRGRPPGPEGSRKVHPSKGYVEVKCTGHPLARRGWVAEHRMALYDAIGPGPHACRWCGSEVEWGRNLHVDHLDHDRGRNVPENLVPACSDCNSRRWAPQLA
jgi:5-methylcytosine-specific restriction endonuclease McrA